MNESTVKQYRDIMQERKSLAPVTFAPNSVRASNDLTNQIKFETLPVLGRGSKQTVELLEALHAQKTSRPNLQCNDVGEVGARAGTPEGLVPLNLPHGSIGDVCLKGHSQLYQVDGPVVPENYVWALVSDGDVLREVVLALKVSCDLHSRWQVVLAEVENDCKDIVMSGCVAPQVKGFPAGVEDVVQKLVLTTELASR